MSTKKLLTTLAPAADVVGPWIQQLRAAALDGISENDVREIVQALVKQAKEGTPKEKAGAIKLLFEYILKPAPQRIENTQNNVVIAPPRPTKARPGSQQKMAAMQGRARVGYALNHPQDAGYNDGDEE